MNLEDAQKISLMLDQFIPVKDVAHMILLYLYESQLQLERTEGYTTLLMHTLSTNLPSRKHTLQLGKWQCTSELKEFHTWLRMWPYMSPKDACAFCSKPATIQVVIHAGTCRGILAIWHDICPYHKEVLSKYEGKAISWYNGRSIIKAARRKRLLGIKQRTP
jgi:hypothetical protein